MESFKMLVSQFLELITDDYQLYDRDLIVDSLNKTYKNLISYINKKTSKNYMDEIIYLLSKLGYVVVQIADGLVECQKNGGTIFYYNVSFNLNKIPMISHSDTMKLRKSSANGLVKVYTEFVESQLVQRFDVVAFEPNEYQFVRNTIHQLESSAIDNNYQKL